MDYTSLPIEQQTYANFGFYALTRLGQEAVLIFFVLSGFLVGGRSIEKLCNGTFQGRNYAIDRFVRIMLPLASALLLYIPVAIWRGADVEWANWFGCWFSLQGIYTGACIEPLWSLSYEVWFYIVVLGIYLAISKKMGGVFYTYSMQPRIYQTANILSPCLAVRRICIHCEA